MSLFLRPVSPIAALLLLGTLALSGCPAPPLGEGGGGVGASVNGTGGASDIKVGSGGSDGINPIKNQPATAACGDGVLDSDEACDDANMMNGDGCGDNCRYVEEGFVCPEAGMPCKPYAKCGDGKLVFPEQCDDGGVAEGDGCSDICKVEVGFKCDGAPSTCVPTVCGDGVQEGAETCEASDGMPFDGCGLTCQAEPNCTDTGCTSSCGDGLVIAPEECDDGNAIPGDGCSETCQLEPGYDCSSGARCPDGTSDCPLALPIVFRDFNVAHGDFHEPDPLGTQNRPCDGHAPGIVASTLDTNRKPTFGAAPPEACVSASTFPEWYGSAPGNYSTVVSEIMLYPNGDDGYVNRMGPDGEQYQQMITEMQTATVRCETAGCCAGEDPWNCCEANDTTCLPCTYNGTSGCAQTFQGLDGNPLFFPLDDHPDALTDTRLAAKIPAQVYGAVTWPWEDPSCDPQQPCPGPLHDFHFTSEIAYWFEYDATTIADLTFIGDDDVWVFVNGHLALDLGGIHVPLAGQLALQGDGSILLHTWLPPENEGIADETLSRKVVQAADLGMSPGGVYEIKVFHAERKPEGSSFQLTLSGFDAGRSECRAICGDGILAAGEQCDNGENNNQGGHNGCNSDCTLGTYCGDGIVQEEEECDDNASDAPSNCAGCRIIVVK